MTKGALIVTAVAAVAVASVAALVSKDEGVALAPPPPKASVICSSGLLVCDAIDSSGKKGDRYRRVEVPSTTCVAYNIYSDGGTVALSTQVEAPAPRKGMDVVPGSCVEAAGVKAPRVADAGVMHLPISCACKGATGTCQVIDANGKLLDAPKGKTLGPGYPFTTFTGAGCVPKSCSELMGETSWPTACPR